MTTYFRNLQAGSVTLIASLGLVALCAVHNRCGGIHTPLPVPRPAAAVSVVRVSPSPVPTPPIQRGSGHGFVSIIP